MTRSETRFRLWAKKKYPGAYIKKLPDFKSSGVATARGLPDYLIIYNSKNIWYEVKTIQGKSISRYHFTDFQLIEFKKMIDNGANLNIWVEGYIKKFEPLLTQQSMKMFP